MTLYDDPKDPAKAYLWDTSAFVKLFLDEGEGSKAADRLFNSHRHFQFITEFTRFETLGVMKRNWKNKKISYDQYARLVILIHEYCSNMKICDVPMDNFGYLYKALGIVKEHNIDIADAAAIVGISNGTVSLFAGNSGPYLITADSGIINAAKLQNLKTIDLRENSL